MLINTFLHGFMTSFARCTVLLFPNVLIVCLYRIDNEQYVCPQGVAGEAPKQQLGEGKCPLTYLCPIHMITYIPSQYDST
jgi:hypothetical protein